jgi:hypothetical protein
MINHVPKPGITRRRNKENREDETVIVPQNLELKGYFYTIPTRRGDVPKGHFAAVFEKIAFDYKHAANVKSLERRLFRHPLHRIAPATIMGNFS